MCPFRFSFVPMFGSDHSDAMSLGERFLNFLQLFLNDVNTRFTPQPAGLTSILLSPDSRATVPKIPMIKHIKLSNFALAPVFFFWGGGRGKFS